MKKSGLLVALLVMFVAASGFAQDSYRQAVKEYLTLNGQANQLSAAIKKLSPVLFMSEDSKDYDQLTERYVEERLLDKMADLVAPKMKERNVTETDLMNANSLFSTPSGKAFNEHQQAWTEAMQGEFPSLMFQHLHKIMTGDTTDLIQPKAEIGARYQEKFRKVMGSQIVESFMGMFDQQTKSFSQFGQLPDGMKKWMNVNLPTLAMNSAYGIITEDDLDFAAQLYNQDSNDKFQILSGMADGQLGSMGIDVITDYVGWMQDNGAVVLDGVLDSFKQMLGKILVN